MDEKQTLDHFLNDSGLSRGSEYVSVDHESKLSPREKHFLDWGRDKIKAEAVLFQRIPINDSCFPLVYFRRLQDANPVTIAEAHRLAWNMGRAPLLFVVLPGKIRVYSTFESPQFRKGGNSLDPDAGLIDILDFTKRSETIRQTLAKYRRDELLSGRYWELSTNRKRFSPSTRVEKNLLDNLSAIRSYLIHQGLPPHIVHSLLGRSIFIQYLQDRKDGNGHSAFPQEYFSRFNKTANTFPDILSDKRKTYELFDSLENKFNGDIFPITSEEYKTVKIEHLGILSSFLKGNITIRSRQLCFWPLYSFDAIPIEFISNMYEEFFHFDSVEKQNINRHRAVIKSGTFYTPHRLVEFLLDEMLPWEGSEYNVRILDPSCGSGIFLVEAYRRLISRWKQKNPSARLDVQVLRNIMTNSLYGVDSNPEAIRVSAFSLYLTMCDYLEPRYIWDRVKFPQLKDKNLWAKDFFEFADSPPAQLKKADLVIGNPPWESKLPQSAKKYLSKRKRVVGDNQIAQAFLWASPDLCRKNGSICLISPSKGLLFNSSATNRLFREQFFNTHQVNLIINFSALRRNLFAKAIGPASPVIYKPIVPDKNHEISYCCPKPWNSPEDSWHFVISDTDIQRIPNRLALQNAYIWKTAMWGGPRDWELVSRLAQFPNLQEITEEKKWIHAEGFIIGSKNKKKAPWITGKPYVDAKVLQPFAMDEPYLPTLNIESFYRRCSENKAIFKGPHLLFGQGPKAGRGFVAAVIRGDAVFRDSIVGIGGINPDDEELLGAVCTALLTDVCQYFAMMTSSKWLVERDEIQKREVMSLPLPNSISEGQLSIPYSVLQSAATNKDVAELLLTKVQNEYHLNECELKLVQDAIKYGLDYFRMGFKSAAVNKASLKDLIEYANNLSSSLRSSFACEDSNGFPISVYFANRSMLAVSVLLTTSELAEIKIKKAPDDLASVLSEMDDLLLDKCGSGLYVHRNVHIYHGRKILIAKRNQCRLWSAATALRDADEIYAEIMSTWETIQ